jgi:hypothetical protein
MTRTPPPTALLLTVTLLGCDAVDWADKWSELVEDSGLDSGLGSPVDYHLDAYDKSVVDTKCVGFSSAVMEWRLPSISGEFTGLPALHTTELSTSRQQNGESLGLYVKTLDITGDGVHDLVVTWDEADLSVGSAHWLVYEGGAGGFSATATQWTLPPIAGDFPGLAPFYSVSVSGARTIDGVGPSEAYRAETFDITGDGVNDLVLTRDGSQAGVSDTHWIVYEGGPGGFSTTGTSWRLPKLEGIFRAGGPFYGLSGARERVVRGADKAYYFETFDVAGDGVSDLVITWDEVDPDSGTAYWLVYSGGARGFSTTATSWTLPPVLGEFQFIPPFHVSSDDSVRHFFGESYRADYSTFDITGDGVSDLVTTWDEMDRDVGNKYWLVFTGGSEGFSTTATEWTLPLIPGRFNWPPFLDLSMSSGRAVDDDYTVNYYNTSTFDITGDGVTDLVVTADELDWNIGSEYWLVYRGEASGFSTTAIRWALPSTDLGYTTYPPLYKTDISAVHLIAYEFFDYFTSTFDITGDGVPDLVITYDGVDENLGTRYWLVYEGLCE